MNSTKFDAIMAEYDKKKIQAHRQLEARKNEVYSQIPMFKQLEDEITSLRTKQAIAKINGSIASEEITNQIEQKKKAKADLLTANQFPSDYLQPIYDCKDCQDTGYLSDRTKCHCLIQRMSEVLFDQSGISDLLQTENFDHLSFGYYEGEDLKHFENNYQKALKFINDFANTYQNLFFYGTVGTGKSFLSCCIAREILKQGYEVLYFSSASLFDKIAEYTFQSSQKQMLAEFTDRLKECDLLIIDDLGTELTNAFVSSELFTILNERNVSKKATIISSNIPFDQLRDHYSDRIFSRVMSFYELAKFTGPDIRMQKKLSSKQ